MDISKVDLTNKNQKLLALLLIIGAVVFVGYMLPTIIWFTKNLIWAGVLLLVAATLAYNYNNIWLVSKQITWECTKWAVSKDKLGFMYQYHDFLVKDTDKLNQSVINLSTMEIKLIRNVNEIRKSYNGNIASYNEYKSRSQDVNKNLLSTLESKIDIDDKRIRSLEPQIENIKVQKDYLIELYDARVHDNEVLKYKLDSTAQEYELLKETAEATGTAAEFLKGNSHEYKLYQESLKQIEQSTSSYIANILDFQRKAAPVLESISMNKKISADEGKRLIEEYNKNRLELEPVK